LKRRHIGRKTLLLDSKEQRLVDAIANRIPTWKGSLLNDAGRAMLVQTTLSAISVHISILLLPFHLGH
jgi:hypothetical protein